MSTRHHIAHIEAYRRQPRPAVALDPILLAAGIECPALSAKQNRHNRQRAATYMATQVARRSPRTEAQKLAAKMARTVEGRAVRQEVQGILARLRWLGAVRG